MKTTVELPDELLREVRDVAERTGTTMRELMIEGLRSEVARRSEDAPRVDFVFATADGNGVQIEPGDMIAISYGMPA